MSKTLTKILTICGLCVVVVAAVVASAVCATAAIGYEVAVDTVTLLNEQFNSPEGKVTVKINGKYTDKLLVKKGEEATITFEAKDFEFQGYYNGDKGTYEGTEVIVDENGVVAETYKVVVNDNMNFTAVFKASKFYKVNLAYNVNQDIADDRSITLGLDGDSVYPDKENSNVYWVKDGSQVTLSHNEVGYKFNNWYQGPVSDGIAKEETFVVEADGTYTADFTMKNKYTIFVETSFDQVVAAEGKLDAKVNGQNSITVYEGTKVTLATSATGYDFVNWTINGTAAGTDPIIEYTVTANAAVKANYKAIVYQVSYNGAEAVSAVYGSELAVAEDSYESTGWKKFAGWKYNGNTVTRAIFAGENRNVTLTGEYRNQANENYVLATGDKSITYNTGRENRLDFTNAPSLAYYNLVGFKLGENEYRFNGNAIAGTAEEVKAFDELLMNSSVNQIAVEPIYELAFDLNFTIKSNNAWGAEGTVNAISAGSTTNIYAVSILERFAREGADPTTLKAIRVYGNSIQGQFGAEDENLQAVKLVDILDKLMVDPNNTNAVNIEIEFIV